MKYKRLPSSRTKRHVFSIFLVCIFIIMTLFAFINDYKEIKQNIRQIREEQARRTHYAIVSEFMKYRENWITSIMGSWLLKHDTYVIPQNRTFNVYVDKYIILRDSSLEGCSVKNCYFTTDNRKISKVDASLVLLHRGISTLPKGKNRNPKQRWIFINDESPYNVFAMARIKPKLEDLANLFNWSMTYRIDADIPWIYGRTVPLDEPLLKILDTGALTNVIPNWKRKRRDVLIAVMVSNCLAKFRLNFIRKIQNYITVDFYGLCSRNETLKHICPEHYLGDCDLLSEYLFYLALENSDCREYLTEKIWYNSYTKGAIPIIMGPSKSDCKRFLPPNSYLYISMNYTDREVKELVKHIIQLSEDDDLLLNLHQWRNHFVVINEHGYVGRPLILCRLCQGLNYNDVREKIYTEQDIRWFLDPELSCGKNNV